jgi:hypothetical protein
MFRGIGAVILASNTSTQPPSPSALFPDGVKARVPVFEKGEPAIEE